MANNICTMFFNKLTSCILWLHQSWFSSADSFLIQLFSSYFFPVT